MTYDTLLLIIVGCICIPYKSSFVRSRICCQAVITPFFAQSTKMFSAISIVESQVSLSSGGISISVSGIISTILMDSVIIGRLQVSFSSSVRVLQLFSFPIIITTMVLVNGCNVAAPWIKRTSDELIFIHSLLLIRSMVIRYCVRNKISSQYACGFL